MELYESEHTKFMRELFIQNPQLTEQQKESYDIWWDKTLDRDLNKRFEESFEMQKGYVYYDKM